VTITVAIGLGLDLDRSGEIVCRAMGEGSPSGTAAPVFALCGTGALVTSTTLVAIGGVVAQFDEVGVGLFEEFVALVLEFVGLDETVLWEGVGAAGVGVGTA